jgi:hypothetical protein
MRIRDLLTIAIAGYVWHAAGVLGWRHALYLRDHVDEVRVRIPRVFYRAMGQ